MKKRVLLLLPLFLGACSDSGESPVIKIEKLYAKIESDGENTSSDEKDYANQREELPALPWRLSIYCLAIIWNKRWRRAFTR